MFILTNRIFFGSETRENVITFAIFFPFCWFEKRKTFFSVDSVFKLNIFIYLLPTLLLFFNSNFSVYLKNNNIIKICHLISSFFFKFSSYFPPLILYFLFLLFFYHLIFFCLLKSSKKEFTVSYYCSVS